jgi:hypothetical protein
MLHPVKHLNKDDPQHVRDEHPYRVVHTGVPAAEGSYEWICMIDASFCFDLAFGSTLHDTANQN